MLLKHTQLLESTGRGSHGGRTSEVRMYSGADKSLARPGRKHATATEDFKFHIYILFIIIIGGILVLFIYIYTGSFKKI